MTDTIAATLRAARDRLTTASDSPDLDARLLLSHVTGLTTSALIIHGDRPLDRGSKSRFGALVERRALGEPVAYILGQVGFWSLDLQVNPSVLIPRPDTETVIETALGQLPVDAPLRIADMGTGSGAIALALGRERPAWQITATDISEKALACARANAATLGISNVEFVLGDWFSGLGGRNFDAIVSNPPYIAPGDPHLHARALAYEPAKALIADDNGLTDLRAIIEAAGHHLDPAGWLCVEHGATQGESVRDLYRRAGYDGVATVRDLGRNERATHGRRATNPATTGTNATGLS